MGSNEKTPAKQEPKIINRKKKNPVRQNGGATA